MDIRLAGRQAEIMDGSLCFTGTRVPVKVLFDYLEGPSSLDAFLEDFPSVSAERAIGVLTAAHATLVIVALHRDTSSPVAAGHDRFVTMDPDIQSGAPVFAGTRVPLRNLFDYLEESDSLDVFLTQFPSVGRRQALAVLEQARVCLIADAHPA